MVYPVYMLMTPQAICILGVPQTSDYPESACLQCVRHSEKYMLTPATRMQGAYQLWYGPDLVHVQGRRARRALMLASLAWQ